MPFEVYQRQRPSAEGPTVSIQRRGVFSLNRAAYEALGAPEAVELLYDRAEKLIALRPADPKLAHAYVLRGLGRSSKESTWLVSGISFTQYYGISTKSARRWAAEKNDGMLVIDLKTPGTPVGAGRRREPQELPVE